MTYRPMIRMIQFLSLTFCCQHRNFKQKLLTKIHKKVTIYYKKYCPLCDAPHINEFEFGNQRECICCRVALDYAADLSVLILDRGRNAKKRKISFLTMTMSLSFQFSWKGINHLIKEYHFLVLQYLKETKKNKIMYILASDFFEKFPIHNTKI